jgi:3-hydroxyacyl-CoA dehydrogenase/3-hydroxy-2-methylbutyryl-CoA dehydrogenase
MAFTAFTVKGLVTLVTGGASGLGRATVERLVRQGGRVVIGDVQTERGEELAKELGAENALFSKLDVTSEADVQATLNATASKFGALHALVNCAGIGIAMKTYNFNKDRPHDLAEFDRVINVNLNGTFNVTRLALRLMCKNPVKTELDCRGVVIHTSSIAAYEGQTGQVAYAASKGAIASMVLPMARDLKAQGIRVNAIAPGLFRTPLLAGLPQKVIKGLESMVVCPSRLGDPDEFAHAVQYLIENPYVNGTVLRVDGALRMPT